MNAEVQKVVDSFAKRLQAEFDRQKQEHVMSLVRGFTFGEALPKTSKNDHRTPAESNSRRKGPIQLCPVPKCKKRAAPVFGMVCSDHKGLSKREIKKHREARRMGKLADDMHKRGRKASRRRTKKIVPQKPTHKEPRDVGNDAE